MVHRARPPGRITRRRRGAAFHAALGAARRTRRPGRGRSCFGRGAADGDPRPTASPARRIGRACADNAGGARRPGIGDAGRPRRCPGGAGPAARPSRAGGRPVATRRGGRPPARFSLSGAEPRSQHAVIEIARYRADPDRPVAQGGDRAVPRAGAERGMTAPAESPLTIRRRGFLPVLSSPSGAGETTIGRPLVELEPTLSLSVSVTTRPARPGEIDGHHYRFIDQARYDAMVAAGELLEHATVFDHSYGTPRQPIDEAIAAGRDIVTDIDWQGTQQVSEKLRDDLVTVFVLPPSMAALEARLRTRAQDSADVVAARMAKSAAEMSHWPEYDYVIVNRDIEDSVAEVRAILTAERLKRTRQVGLGR